MRKIKKLNFSLIMGFVIALGIILIVGNIIALCSTNESQLRQINKEKMVDATISRKVRIKSGTANIQIIRGNSNQIKAQLEGKGTPKYANKVDIKLTSKGDTIELEVIEPQKLWPFFTFKGTLDLKLAIELPQKNWDSADITATTGNINVSEWNGHKVSIHTGSGNINVKTIEADTITLDTGSGDIIADQFKAKIFTFKTGSGAVGLTNGKAILKGNTGSGNINVKTVEADTITLDTGSGDIIADQFKAKTFTFKTGSGNVELTNGKAVLKGNTGSGDIKVVKVELQQGYHLDSGSGSVTIEND